MTGRQARVVMAAAVLLLWAGGSPVAAAHVLLGGAQRPGAPFDALVAVLALVSWSLVGYLAAVALAVLVARLPGAAGRTAARGAGRLAPVAVRRALELGMGLTLATASTVGLTVGTASASVAPAAQVTQTSAEDTRPSAAPTAPDSASDDPATSKDPATSRDPIPPSPGAPLDWPSAPADPPLDWPSAPPPSLPSPLRLPVPSPLRLPLPSPLPGLADRTPAPSTGARPTANPSSHPSQTPSTTPVRPSTAPAAAAGPGADGTPALTTPPPPAPARADSTATPSQEVVVRPGDTLWGLAERELQGGPGPAPTVARIAERWPQWWAVNRTVLGEDPDLIHPGQVLQPPPV